MKKAMEKEKKFLKRMKIHLRTKEGQQETLMSCQEKVGDILTLTCQWIRQIRGENKSLVVPKSYYFRGKVQLPEDI